MVPARRQSSIRTELRGQLLLAGPLCLSQVGQHLLSVVDTAMLGRYSQAALAGSGVAGAFFFAVAVLGIGTVMGLDTLIPQSLGAGDRERAHRYFLAGTRLALIVSAALTLLCLATPSLLSAIGTAPAVLDEATPYLYARIPSLIPVLLATAARSYLQAAGITRPIVIAAVLGNIINVLANSVLIFGDDTLEAIGIGAVGLPALGAVGAGLSSSIVSCAMTAIVVYATPKLATGRPSQAEIRDVVRIGAPVGLQLGLEVGIFATVSALASVLGTTPAAGHQIALTLASLSFAIAAALGASSSARVGLAIGRGDRHGARAAGFVGMALGGGLMACFGVVFMVAPELLGARFTDEPAALAAAVPLIRIAAVFQLSDASQAIAAGALRGLGDNRATFWGNLIGHYGVGLPLMLLLGFWADLGAEGLWWGLSAGLTFVAVALTLRFHYMTSRAFASS